MSLLFNLPKELLLIIFQRFLPISQTKRIYTILLQYSKRSQQNEELVFSSVWTEVFLEILGCNYTCMGDIPPNELLYKIFNSKFLSNPLTREIIQRWKLGEISVDNIGSKWFILKNGNIAYIHYSSLKVFRMNDCLSMEVSADRFVELIDGRFATGSDFGSLKIWSLDDIDHTSPIEDEAKDQEKYRRRFSYDDEENFCNSTRYDLISIDTHESMVTHSLYLESMIIPKPKHSPFWALMHHSKKPETIKKRVGIPSLATSLWEAPTKMSGLIQLPNGWIVSCCEGGQVVIWDPCSVENCYLFSFQMPRGGAYLLRHLPWFPPAPATPEYLEHPHGHYFLVMGDEDGRPYRIVDSLFLVHREQMKKQNAAARAAERAALGQDEDEYSYEYEEEDEDEDEEGKDTRSKGWMEVETSSVLYDLIPLQDGRRYLTINGDEEVQIWTFSTVWDGPRARHEVLWDLSKGPDFDHVLLLNRGYVYVGDIGLLEKQRESENEKDWQGAGDLCLKVNGHWFWWKPCRD